MNRINSFGYLACAMTAPLSASTEVPNREKTGTILSLEKTKCSETTENYGISSIELFNNGGHGDRTRNRFPGTSFPMKPLAIRLPSFLSDFRRLTKFLLSSY